MASQLRNIAFAAVLVVVAAWSSEAKAASAVGVWKSTSGNVFIIPNNPKEFEIVCKKTDGTKQVLVAKWVSGLVGTQFKYGNGSVTCTFNANNPDSMRVENVESSGQKVVTFWVRVSN